MTDIPSLELICVIVNFGLASKIVGYAKEHGITGCTIFLGKGTIRNTILEFLELTEVRREVVLMVANKDTAYNALDKLNEKFKFDKPNHGIAFSMPVLKVLGTHCIESKNSHEIGGAKGLMCNLIFIVVDRGKAEFVVDAANKAGSRGATIINGRGSGIHETNKLFAMEIEPEKEIVLIISQSHLTDAIATSIRNELKIEEPGNGIIFIQDVNKTYGLY